MNPRRQQRDDLDWPHQEASRYVDAGGLRWHVQRLGAGPALLMLHGVGASAHSWRALMPALAERFDVIAIDLPGHAATSMPPPARMSLPGIARSIEALIETLAIDVDVIVGHSAGAAIGARLALDGRVRPRALISINGAFFPLSGLSGLVFPPVARLMAATPFAAQLFAGRGWDLRAVERLIAGTGSTLDARGLELYGRLIRDPSHAAGALAMMARWDLRPLARDLARLVTPLTLIVGANDLAVSPRDAQRVMRLLPASTRSSLHVVDDAGHLVQEERPADVLRLMLAATSSAGELEPATGIDVRRDNAAGAVDLSDCASSRTRDTQTGHR